MQNYAAWLTCVVSSSWIYFLSTNYVAWLPRNFLKIHSTCEVSPPIYLLTYAVRYRLVPDEKIIHLHIKFCSSESRICADKKSPRELIFQKSQSETHSSTKNKHRATLIISADIFYLQQIVQSPGDLNHLHFDCCLVSCISFCEWKSFYFLELFKPITIYLIMLIAISFRYCPTSNSLLLFSFYLCDWMFRFEFNVVSGCLAKRLH